MAFTTEFVMGAGGAEVEEIPVSMVGGGQGVVYPLATVDAGEGALIVVTGDILGGYSSSSRPDLYVGPVMFDEPQLHLTASSGFGTWLTGTVQVSVRSNTSGDSSFTGTVYVVRL